MDALSILIPAYNWDCSQLIKDLHFQGLVLGIPYEIIVADDCSDNRNTVEINHLTAKVHENCRYIGLARNIGRAAIRNLLADNAKYDKLLFLDCDASVRDKFFLKNYCNVARKAQVVCGGVIHSNTIPEPGVELRWCYEKSADMSRSAMFRNQEPYSKFTSFSFMIDRDVFMKTRFDESYIEYGYEDVQFGLELKKKGISILHIDNPLIHLGLEKSPVFLAKTKQAILNAYEHSEGIGSGGARLIAHFNRVKRLKVRWFFRLVWAFTNKSMERNLLSSKPSLRLFSLYKLSYICLLK